MLSKELAYGRTFVAVDNISSLMSLLIKTLALHEANFGFLYMSNAGFTETWIQQFERTAFNLGRTDLRL